MSFSKDTKLELCKFPIKNDENKRALLYGMVIFSRVFNAHAVSMTTECKPVSELYSELLSSMTATITQVSVNITRRKDEGRLYSVCVPDKNDCMKIYDFFGHSEKQLSLRINRANIDGDECFSDFIRGAFLSCGNVTNPEKDYHLEFVVPHKNIAEDLKRLISEIEQINAEPNIINRKGNYIVYIKDGENIEDLLTYMGAQMSSISIMQNRIIKSVRNNVNRKTNSETANIKRTANAAAEQINAINIISKVRGLDSLSDDLKELALLRLENPEYSLRELGEALSVPISRSGVNHRIRRIIDISQACNEKNNTV